MRRMPPYQKLANRRAPYRRLRSQTQRSSSPRAVSDLALALVVVSILFIQLYCLSRDAPPRMAPHPRFYKCMVRRMFIGLFSPYSFLSLPEPRSVSFLTGQTPLRLGTGYAPWPKRETTRIVIYVLKHQISGLTGHCSVFVFIYLLKHPTTIRSVVSFENIVCMDTNRMAGRSLSQKAWSRAEPDYDDCYEPEYDWDLEDESFVRPWESKTVTNGVCASPWWQQKKEEQKATFERHGQLHPALSWNFMAEGYKHIVYKGPRCNKINREADLRWDKHSGRGDRYAVLHDGDEVYMIVATAPAFKKHGSDPRAYEETLFIRPDGSHFVRPG